MQKRLLAATALTTSVVFLVPGGVALAQQGTYNWSGPYVGVVINETQSNSTFQQTGVDSYFDVPSTINLPHLGTGGGVVGGYNFQDGTFVYGIEGDASFLPLEGTTNGNNYSVEDKLNALLTLRARIGKSFDRLMVYGTAGLGVGDVSFNGDVGKGPGNDGYKPSTGSGIAIGPVVGVGLEYAVTDNLSLKAEAKYYTLGQIGGVGDTGKGGSGPYSASYQAQGAMFSTGLNFHF